jgi:molybdate transport system substrate-binding protein
MDYHSRPLFTMGLCIWAALVCTACRQRDATGSNQPRRSSAAVEQNTRPVVLSAAASTKELMEELSGQFQKESGAHVQLNLGGSNSLATQIINGSPADLFLSADPEWVTAVAEAGLVEEQVPLLVNRLVIVTPRGNPAGVTTPSDLSRDSVKHLALAGESVPAGKYADQALRTLGILDQLVHSKKIVRGQDVRVSLSYVERAEAEAGIVYATDAIASRNVEVVYQFDPKTHDPIIYVLARLRHARQNPQAAELYSFLQSTQADSALESRGFHRPGPDPLTDAQHQ